MPHIPRRNSPTVGVPMELMGPPRAHSPIPTPQTPQSQSRPASPQQADTPQGKRRKLGLSKLDPHTFEPDIKKIVKAMFGKEPDVDENTGQLVLDQPAPAAAPAAGDGGQAAPGNAVRPVLGRLADPHAHRPPPGFAGEALR